MTPAHSAARSGGTWRLTAYPVAVIVAIALAVILGAVDAADSDAPGEEIGGDYPAFYGAGRIAATGDLDELHTVERQVEAQTGLYEGEVTRFFPYPAQFAVVYQPLSQLDYVWSYLAHTLIMALLLWLSILVARPMLPWLYGRVALAYATSLVFWPMFRTITGGSNTGLSLFLITAGFRLVYDGHHLAAGVTIAAMLYKPQFAIPLLGLFLLGRYWRVVTGAIVAATAYYAWGVALLGWSWAIDWVSMARDFGAREAAINGHSSISFIGFAENLFGVGFNVPVVLAWTCAVATALLLGWTWWRGDVPDLGRRLAVTVPGILLLAPHVMSHDGALVVLPVAVGVQAWDRYRWIPWVTILWVLGATQSLIRQLGFSPGFLMLLIALGWAWQFRREHSVEVGNRPAPVSV